MDKRTKTAYSDFCILLFLVWQRSKSKVYTINLSMAYGQAAMLLSLGVKGKRGVLPNSISMLHFLSFVAFFSFTHGCVLNSIYYILVLNAHY